MCPRELQTRPQGEMSFDLFKKVVDELVPKGMNQVTLVSYGEPLLDPGFYQKALYAKKSYDLKLYTITTAAELSPKLSERLIDLKFDTVRISYYGITKDVYQSVHQSNTFEIATQNIYDLLELKKQKRSLFPRVDMSWIRVAENAHQTDAFKKNWRSKVDGISIWNPHNWSDGRRYRQLDSPKTTCGRPATGPVQVQWNGDVVPCCWDYDNKMVLGNASTHTIEEILKGDSYKALRNAHAAGNFKKYPFCDQCDQLHQKEMKDALIYSNIGQVKTGRTNTNYFPLTTDAQ